MSITNVNYVCCDCRKHRRGKSLFTHAVHKLDVNPVCHLCKKSMEHIGTRRKVPKYNDKKGWKMLANDIKLRKIPNDKPYVESKF